MVLLRCLNKRPIKALVRFAMTMNFSLIVMSPTSNCNSTVAIGASNCPLATIIWNSGGGLHLKSYMERVIKFCVSRLPDWLLKKAPVSLSPSTLNFPKSIGKNSILSLFFNDKFVDSRRFLVSPSGVT